MYKVGDKITLILDPYSYQDPAIRFIKPFITEEKENPDFPGITFCSKHEDWHQSIYECLDCIQGN